MRLFIAVPVAAEVREHVGALMAELRKSGADCKWVAPRNLHLTLAFLGEVAEERLSALERALEEAAAGRAAFPMAFRGAGTFDSPRGPRIVWLGMDQGGPELTALGTAVAEALSRAGFPVQDRPFHPHLTLGRLRSQRNVLRLADGLKRTQAAAASPACTADRLELVASRLSDRGPSYTTLRERRLHA